MLLIYINICVLLIYIIYAIIVKKEVKHQQKKETSVTKIINQKIKNHEKKRIN